MNKAYQGATAPTVAAVPMPAPLPDERQKAVEAGIAMYQQACADRDHLREELRLTKEELARKQIELNSLSQLHNMLESHIESYMLQRDEATNRVAVLEALVISIKGQIGAFETKEKKNPSELLHELSMAQRSMSRR